MIGGVRPAWVVWSIWLVMASCTILDLPLIPTQERGRFLAIGGWIVAIGTFPTVGAIVASRRPGHRLGWVFLACGLASVGYLARHATEYGLGAEVISGSALDGTAVLGNW